MGRGLSMRLMLWILLLAVAAATAQMPADDPTPAPAAGPDDGAEDPLPAPPGSETAANDPEAGEDPLWPPKMGAGDYYGNSLPGLFGGSTYEDTPFQRQAEDQPSIFRQSRTQERLNVSGFADLNFSLRSVSGATETFSQDQYGKDQTITENASLLLAGPLWKWANLNVHAQIEQRSFGFNDTDPVWRVFWEDGNNRVTIGDITPSVGDTNEFVPFSRRLTGLQAEGRLGGRFEYMMFGSQVGGSIRNETFVGDGTPGPYFLTFVPIVDGSSVVVVDGIVQQPGYGDTGDYTLNPSTGELIFNGTRIIPPTSRIEVRYETLSSGGPKDLLLGGQVLYNPMRRWRLGLQYITQLAGSDGGLDGPVEQRVTDQLTVPTPSQGPFTIRPRPIVPGSETVQVNGILQERDVDYEIAYETGELRFFSIQPEGANILVRFSIINAVDLGSGDRSILGFDTSYTLGDKLNVQLQYAQSSGSPGSRANPFSFSGSGSSYYNSGAYGSGYGTGYGSYGTGYGNYGGYGSSYGGYGSNVFGSSTYGSYGGGGYNPGGNYNSGVFGSNYRSRSGRRTRGIDSVSLGWDALSRQTSPTQSPSGGGGSAYKLAVNSRLGDFQFAGQLKAVSDNFSRIDSTSFFQNEQGFGFQAQYSSGPRFNVGYQFDRYSRPYSFGTGDDDEVLTSRVINQQSLFALTWRFTKDSLLNFTHNGQQNGGGSSSNRLSRQSLTLNHRFSNQFQINAGLDRAGSGTSGLVGTSGSSVANDSTTTSGRFGLSYNSTGGRFGARFDYSFSNTDSSISTNSASSILGSLNYQPFKWLALQVSHQLSDSNNTSNVGRTFDRLPQPGTLEHLLWRMEAMRRRQAGVGAFDPTGDSGIATDPLTGDSVTTSLITNNKSQNSTISMLLTPMKQMSVTTNFSHSVTDNGRLAGSTSDSFQTNLHYQITDRMGVGFGYSNQALRYTDTGDTTNTGIFNLNFDWRLSNHLDVRYDYQTLSTTNAYGPREEGEPDPTASGYGGDTSYGSWGLDLRWQLPGRAGHSYFASLRNDSNSGGLNTFSRFNFQTGMDFRLTSILGLRLSYDMTDYANSGESDNSYLAHLFNASVGARF